MTKQHTLRDTLKVAGATDIDGATAAAVVIVTDDRGCSIITVQLDMDTVVSMLEPPTNPDKIEPRQLATVLAIAGQDLVSALVQDAGLGHDPRSVTLEEGADGSLQDSVLKGIFKAPGTMQ